MKKIKIFTVGFLLFASVMQSCKKDLQEINTNLNSLPDTRPEFLFTSATLNYSLGRRDQMLIRYSTAMRLMQYIVGDNVDKTAMESPYYDPTKPNTAPNPAGSQYNDYFGSVGRDYHRIIEKIDGITDPVIANGYKSLRAICMIMDTYDAWKVADIYGALPYSQAFKVAQYPTPSYDYDFDLYKQFDQQLKDAADVLKANTGNQKDISKQDFFYGGDRNKWMHFANTLRVKIAQRYEKRDQANFTAVINDISSNYGSAVIASIDESFGYDNLQNWMNNTNDIDGISLNYVAAFPFVEFLKSTNDPRIRFMVRENDWGTNYDRYNTILTEGTPAALLTLNKPEYNTSRFMGKHVFSASSTAAYDWWGQPKTHSFDLNDGTSLTLNFISTIQARLFVKNGGYGNSISGTSALHSDETVVDGNTIKMRTQLLGYAEACFMYAEIAAKGSGSVFGKTAAQWYTDGVTASFNDYKARAIAGNVPGASSVTIGDYLTRYPYNGLKSIYSQAWVNGLLTPEETWAMWKRTGYPELEDYRAGQTSRIGDGSGIAYLENLYTGTQNLIIPRRAVLPYSSTEMVDNFNKAISDMKTKDPAYGANERDTKGRIWWDK
ncbi:MAG TPA: SusD/RagB family nutrient-binding outer membrane lipoprotein [Chitinophagaceae bacterium]|nr:SusD/RagB family nutrient-binding outer membrane lipoprotein [Chitinophagaceae bacterium]